MIKSVGHLQSINLLSTPQIGRVVDNKDPRHLQRVKVFVKGVYEESDVSKLPWAFPKSDSGLGGKPDSSNFQIPEIDSEINITWVDNDVYHPFYQGRRLNELTAPKEPFLEDYPNSYGTLNSNLEWTKCNKEQKYWEFFSNELGKFIKWDGEGNVWINIPKDLIVQVGGKTYLNIKGNYASKINGKTVLDSDGEIRVNSGSPVSVDAPRIDWNSQKFSPPGSSEIALLMEEMKKIDDKIKELKEVAKAIKERTDAAKPDIAKKTNT